MQKPIIIALQHEEATALLQLLDVAVKASGLQAAKAAIHLSDKVIEAAKQSSKEDNQGE